jgi:hypothetical protein
MTQDAISADGQATTGQFGHVVYLNFSGGPIMRAGLNNAHSAGAGSSPSRTNKRDS